jgi:secondary thiamine-phosphate synthase enzyme
VHGNAPAQPILPGAVVMRSSHDHATTRPHAGVFSFKIDTLETNLEPPMKSFRKELWFNLPTRRGFENITAKVQVAIDDSGIKEGLVLINAMHISASVFINDDEAGLLHDWEVWLEKLAPEHPHSHYRHNDTGEDNADAHLKRTIMGRETVVAITNGKLDFGPWEQIFYGEFDGKRRKRVLIKIIGE